MNMHYDEKVRRRSWRGLQAGFTLVELLVVMVILGLLASIALPNFFRQGEKARIQTAKVQIATLGAALDAFALDVGRYPDTQEGLNALLDPPSGLEQWDGPYLKKSVPKDPWGNPYQYRGPDGSGDYEIVSFGADGRAGGDAGSTDISSAE